MKVLYALICEDASTRPDGRVDVHGVFHQLYAPGFPAQQDRLVLAAAVEWEEERGRIPFRIDLIDPVGSPALTISGHTDVGPRPPREAPQQTRIVMPLENVVFPVEGSYEFELVVEDDRRRLAPLHLIEDPDAR